MFEVSVYYNTTAFAMLNGYKEGDWFNRVATVLCNQADVFHCAERVFIDMQEPENKPLLRSMSVGDVLCVRYCLGDGLCTTGIWLACARQGFTLIDQPRYIR
jgi:hypothetical protein